MERAGSNNKEINYLDLNINITTEGLEILVYNEINDFNFHVVSLTFPHSNIPTEVGYNVFFSQVLRYGNICTRFDIFTFHLHKIFKILVDRGYNRGKLIKNIQRCLEIWYNIFRKFGILDDDNIIDELPCFNFD